MNDFITEFLKDFARKLLYLELRQYQNKISQLESEKKELRKKIYELKNKNSEIKKEYETKIKELNQEINDLEERIKKLISLEEKPVPKYIQEQFNQLEDKTGFIHKYRRKKITRDRGVEWEWLDVRTLTQVGDSRIIQICKKIDSLYHPETLEDVFLAVFRWQARHVKYQYDDKKWGSLDYWAFPSEVFLEKDSDGNLHSYRDDCETRAVTTVSLLLNYKFVNPKLFVPWWMVWVDLGFIHGSGHGWVRFLDPRDMKTWRIYEATSPSPPKTLNLRRAVYDENNPYDMYYCFNSKKILLRKGDDPIFGSNVGGKMVDEKLDKSVKKAEEFLMKIKGGPKGVDKRSEKLKKEIEELKKYK